MRKQTLGDSEVGALISYVADVGKSICGGALGAPSAGLGLSQPGCMCFVGFEIAFDGVTQGFLWEGGAVQPVANLIHFDWELGSFITASRFTLCFICGQM